MGRKLSKTEDEKKTQGRALKEYREKKGLSQEKLYDLLFPSDDDDMESFGMDSQYKRSYICNWEIKRGIPDKYIDRVAQVLEVPRLYLSGIDITANLKKAQNDTSEMIGIYISLLGLSKHSIIPVMSSDKSLLNHLDNASPVFADTIQHIFMNTDDYDSFVYAVKIDDDIYDLASLEKMIRATISTIDNTVDNMLMLTASIS